MTSGKFKSYPIDKIVVNRDARQRRELADIDKLAASLQSVGQINPITITANGELIAGERRLAAARSLGWDSILVHFAEDLSEQELYAIELEENTKRLDLSWQDQCRAVERYHNLRTELDETWTADSTAQALGIAPSEISRKRAVAKELETNEQVKTATKFSVAWGIVNRAAERKTAQLDKQLNASQDETETPDVPLLNVSFIDWQRTYDGPLFNLIHCDFPYGVNADKHDQGAASSFGGYADGYDIYKQLLDCLGASMRNVVAPSAHLMFWFSMDYYQETFDALSEMGWRVDPFPLIWYKNDNTGILPDANRGPRRTYETAFLASRGDRKIVRAVSNVTSAPVIKRIHMSEKNADVIRQFFRMLVDGSSYVLDPTAGSGNALKVAEGLGAEKVLGLEINKEFYELAKEHWDE